MQYCSWCLSPLGVRIEGHSIKQLPLSAPRRAGAATHQAICDYADSYQLHIPQLQNTGVPGTKTLITLDEAVRKRLGIVDLNYHSLKNSHRKQSNSEKALALIFRAHSPHPED
jgi:hypothetical protein